MMSLSLVCSRLCTVCYVILCYVVLCCVVLCGGDMGMDMGPGGEVIEKRTRGNKNKLLYIPDDPLTVPTYLM